MKWLRLIWCRSINFRSTFFRWNRSIQIRSTSCLWRSWSFQNCFWYFKFYQFWLRSTFIRVNCSIVCFSKPSSFWRCLWQLKFIQSHYRLKRWQPFTVDDNVLRRPLQRKMIITPFDGRMNKNYSLLLLNNDCDVSSFQINHVTDPIISTKLKPNEISNEITITFD